MFNRIAIKRGEAVSREIMKKVADDKKMSKQEKEERWVISYCCNCEAFVIIMSVKYK